MQKGLVIFLVCSVLATVGLARQAETKELKQRTVSVRGMGMIATAPDQVRLSVQVNTRAESATAAMASASAKTRDILAIVKAEGVDPRDVQTSRVTVSPIYDYQRNIQPPPITGYSGVNEFSVVFKGKLMEGVGDFMDQAVNAGATGFGGLQYEASRQREFERDALKNAARDAQARAEVLARELGATLGKVQSITELVSGPVPVSRGIMSAESAISSTPVMTGQLTINAQVDVVFELK